MTEVIFYSRVDDKLTMARKIVSKMRGQNQNILIFAPDQRIAAEMDRLLWTQPAQSFIPHCLDSDPLAASTPVLIGTSADMLASADVIINLSDETPPVFSRFSKLMEIVTNAERDVTLGRQRYRYYKDCGYQLANHDMQEYSNDRGQK